MKVYISVDMEGIAGVVSWSEQTGPSGHDFGRFRRLMTREANAAVEGALAGGATEVVVNDAHGGMKNLIIEELNPEARLISGTPKPWGMIEGLDSSFGAVFLVGYHSRACSGGVLNHTYSGYVQEYRVNGRVFGETGMYAARAGAYGVPVVLVTGDTAVQEEAQELLGQLGPLETVAVKRPVGRYAADNLHPEKACTLIREAAERAIANAHRFKPFRVDQPVTISMRFSDSAMADGAMRMPGVKRLDYTTVGYEAPDYPVALQAAQAMIHLASPPR